MWNRSLGFHAVSMMAVCVAFAACAGSGRERTEDDDGTGATTGSGGGGGAGGSGGSPSVTAQEICEQYLECLALASPSELALAIDAYGDGGSCWSGAPDLCGAACLTGLAQHHDDSESCPECFEDAHCAMWPGTTCAEGSCMQPCPDGDLGSSLPISLDGTTRGALNTQGGSCGGSSGPERVYRFTVPSTSMYFIDVMGMDFDTTLTILDGTCGGPEIACNDDGGPGSQIVLELTAGQVIMIVVDAYGSGSGAFTLTIDNTPY